MRPVKVKFGYGLQKKVTSPCCHVSFPVPKSLVGQTKCPKCKGVFKLRGNNG